MSISHNTLITIILMRIACLLPSATDIVIALGLADYIVGVTHECNLDSLKKNRSIQNNDKVHILTRSGLYTSSTSTDDGDATAAFKTQGEIDVLVKQASSNNNNNNDSNINSIYPIIQERLHLSKPTIILTQNLCNVCAPSLQEVQSIIGHDNTVQILSLGPTTLHDVAETFVQVAAICHVKERGRNMKNEFVQNLNLITETINNHCQRFGNFEKKRVLLLEWLDPPYDAGHWIPDMIEASGCTPIRINPSTKSKIIPWDEIYAADPDIVLIACCGFDLRRNVEDALKYSSKLKPLRAAQNQSIFACNGDMHFTRPGPTLLDGVFVVARCAFHDNSAINKALDDLSIGIVSSSQWERVQICEQDPVSSGLTDIEDAADYLVDFMAVHDDACVEGKMVYEDPATGYKVFTELAHKKRGKCCGSGCRHCPYNHENVKNKASAIIQPAFLYEGRDDNSMHYSDDDEKHVKVLFFSGGKDSFLAIRAVLRSAEKARRKICLILLTTFDATSRVIAHQDMHIDTIIKQASHMNLPLIGVPVIRASKESYVSRINRALDLIANYCGGRKRILSLVFGDLFLDHIRSWREKEMKQLGCILEFPLWKVPYELLLDDLKLSGIDVVLSASTRNGIQVGDKFDHDFLKRIKSSDSSIDLFGENGEFHTIAKVWVVSKQQALGT